jgi:hypothetical protein
LKILVYEHVSGGGYSGQPLDLSVLAEGFGMLRTLVADFKAAGNDVTVLIDARISKLNPPIAADCIVPFVSSKKNQNFLLNTAKINDAVYVIAPETGQTLQSLVTLVEQTGKISLNCDAGIIGQVADKTALYGKLRKQGLRAPETLTFDFTCGLAEVKNAIKGKLSYPVVFKPSDGVSCSGLSVVNEESQVERAIAKTKAVSAAKEFIVQEFVRGEAASVSLLCTGAEAMAISLNRQNIKLATPEAASSYEGGAAPFDHPLRREAFTIAENAARSFAGLRGYVGVDLVLGEDEPFVVDVNPRLTTSYVGLSSVAGFNIAEAILDAVLNDKLPKRREIKNFVFFSKVEAAKPTVCAFQEATRINGVVSPPFPLGDDLKSVSLVAGHGNSVENARLQFEEAKKRLLYIISGGK